MWPLHRRTAPALDLVQQAVYLDRAERIAQQLHEATAEMKLALVALRADRDDHPEGPTQ